MALLDELGRALQHSSTAFLQPSRDAEILYEPLLELVPPYLLHSLGSVRLAAFHLLVKYVFNYEAVQCVQYFIGLS